MPWVLKPTPDPTTPFIRIRDFNNQPGVIGINERLKEYVREFCPHKAEWANLDTAHGQVPPCWLYMAGKRKTSCPSGEEMDCSKYSIARLRGKEQPQAMRVAAGDTEGALERLIERMDLPASTPAPPAAPPGSP